MNNRSEKRRSRVRERSQAGHTSPANLDFSADPKVVSAIAEAHRLSHGHLLNPVFASETSRIDPLPHQRLAVYNHMLQQSPLRFLLADDAGAGKTIMTGLYVREMLTRRLLHRILIVPPAGLWATGNGKCGTCSACNSKSSAARTHDPGIPLPARRATSPSSA